MTQTQAMAKPVIGEKKGHIFYLTLNRPDKRNAITFEMVEEMSEMMEGLILDAEVRVIILKGEGKVFSAGVDFQSLAGLVGRFMTDAAAGGAPIRADISRYQSFITRFEAVEIPIICALQGRVVGLGLEMSLACDIRLMSDDCLWWMPELRFSIVPDLGGTARLARIVGQAKAMEILMTGRTYTAQQALDFGLINGIFPAESLLSEAEKMAEDIIAMGPLAVGAVKRIIKKGEGVDLMTHLDMEGNLQSILLRSDDFKEGVQALMEGRKPTWRRK
jgi:enoyl-CoA hydratase/carnithine racemase